MWLLLQPRAIPQQPQAHFSPVAPNHPLLPAMCVCCQDLPVASCWDQWGLSSGPRSAHTSLPRFSTATEGSCSNSEVARRISHSAKTFLCPQPQQSTQGPDGYHGHKAQDALIPFLSLLWSSTPWPARPTHNFFFSLLQHFTV